MAVDYALTGRPDPSTDPYGALTQVRSDWGSDWSQGQPAGGPTYNLSDTMSATYGGLGGQISPSFGNAATPQFGTNTSGQRFADLQSALGNIGYQRSGIQRERATTLDDLTRQFQQTRRPIPGQFNRRGMLDSGQYQRSVGRTYEDELRRAGRYELGVQEALNALAAQQLGAEQQYSRGRLQDALNAAQAKATMSATIPEGAFPALSSTPMAAAAPALGIPTLPDIPPPIIAPPPPPPAPAPPPAVVAPPPPPPPPPEAIPEVPDLDWIAAYQDQQERAQQALRDEQQARQVAALAKGTAGEYFLPEQTGYGATTIAPYAMNPEGYASHSISVPWRPGATAAHPDDMAAAAERMVANMIYDPSVSQGLGGYTMNAPGLLTSERARIAAAIQEATG